MSPTTKKDVRLSAKEVRIIKEAAEEIFGSRADLTRKGGDINIFIETGKAISIEDEIKFLAVLERKVDLVVKSKDKKYRPVFDEAKRTKNYCILNDNIKMFKTPDDITYELC